MDYTSLSEANALALELTGLDGAPTDLDALLEDSAATHTADGVTVHRPYYVAAQVLDRQANTSRLRQARGATFDPPAVRIRALRRQQAAFDEAMLDEHADYTIPPGHDAYPAASLVF